MTSSADWDLIGFEDWLDLWCRLELPDQPLRNIVTGWIRLRYIDPYRGMDRVDGFPNLWFGIIPGTALDGTVTTCTYEIHEATRTVVCKGIGTLNTPL